MAIYKNSPPIITNGLVLALDAANMKSYPGSGTVWSDLSGNNNNGSLVGTPASSGGSLNFNGSTQYGVLPTTVYQSLLVTNKVTLDCWVYTTSNKAIEGIINFYNTSAMGWFLFYNTGALSVQIGNGTTLVIVIDPNTSLNQWNHCTVTYDGSIINLYRNSKLVNSGAQTGNLPIVTSNIWIASSYDIANTARYWQGNISTVRIYNRALSAAEILQNYNAQKSRFNLS